MNPKRKYLILSGLISTLTFSTVSIIVVLMTTLNIVIFSESVLLSTYMGLNPKLADEYFENLEHSKNADEEFKNMGSIMFSEDFLAFLEEYKSIIIVIAILIPFLIILILSLANGWRNLAKNVKKIDLSDILKKLKISFENREVTKLLNSHNISFYRGKGYYSYGFYKQKIILSWNFFTSNDNDFRSFALLHEKYHLVFRDSIVKNLVINFTRYFLPFFLFFAFFRTLAAIIGMYSLSNAIQGKTFCFMMVVILFIYTAITYKKAKKIIEFFSLSKEFLCDRLAYLSTYYSPIPKEQLKQPQLAQPNKYHPSLSERLSNLEGSNSNVDIKNILFVATAIVNCSIIGLFQKWNIFIVEIFIAIFSLTIFFDLLKTKLYYINTKGFILIFLINILFIVQSLLYKQCLLPSKAKMIFEVGYSPTAHIQHTLFFLTIISLYFILSGFQKIASKNV